MKYDSMQAFLEAHLKEGSDRSDQQISLLKTQWRKLYLAQYHKKYQEDHVQITFRVTKRQFTRLNRIAGDQNLKPTALCRRLIVDKIDGNTTMDLQPLRVIIMEGIDMVERYQYEGKTMLLEKLLELLNQMFDTLK